MILTCDVMCDVSDGNFVSLTDRENDRIRRVVLAHHLHPITNNYS